MPRVKEGQAGRDGHRREVLLPTGAGGSCVIVTMMTTYANDPRSDDLPQLAPRVAQTPPARCSLHCPGYAIATMRTGSNLSAPSRHLERAIGLSICTTGLSCGTVAAVAGGEQIALPGQSLRRVISRINAGWSSRYLASSKLQVRRRVDQGGVDRGCTGGG